MDANYMISDVSKKLEVEAHVLRFWEDELNISIPRNKQGYRCYTDKEILIFKRIKQLRDCGYQLRAVRLILNRLTILDDEEFGYISALADEMNKRAASVFDKNAAPSEKRSGSIIQMPGRADAITAERMSQFQALMTQIMQNALESCSEKISSDIIRELDCRMKNLEYEQEKHFEKIDEMLCSKRRMKKEAAAGKFSLRFRKRKPGE